MKRVGVLMAVVFFLNGVVGSSVFAEGEEAERGGAGQIFLSWSGDPKTTQTVTWGDMERSGKFLQYRKAGTESFSKPIEARETEIGEQETFRYEVVLDNLVPGTSYEYRVGAPGQWSGISSFKTEEEEQASFSAFVLGDVQFNVREEDYAVWGKFLRDAYKEHPETQFALMTGDYVNTANLWRDWNCYLNQAAVFSCIPVMTAPGNHETQYLPFTYLKLFALPENGPEGAAEEFYSFDYAGCHFVSLNSCVLMREREKFMGESAWDDLIDGIDVWLKEDLQKNRKKWNVVFLHHPAYGVDENSRLSEEIRKRWVPIFEDAGVDLVLCGHQHVYMRSETINGVTYIMGNSGQKRSQYYNAERVPSYVEKVNEEHSVYGILYGDEKTLRLTVYDETHTPLDVWEKDRMGQPPAAVFPGTALTAVGVALVVIMGVLTVREKRKKRNEAHRAEK